MQLFTGNVCFVGGKKGSGKKGPEKRASGKKGPRKKGSGINGPRKKGL